MYDKKVSPGEREYLRDLAKRQKEYSLLPEMGEKERLWYAHNSLSGFRPVIVVEEETFLKHLLPPLTCTSEAGRWMEQELLQKILAFEKIGDDKVVPGYFTVFEQIHIRPQNLELKKVYASNGLGFHIEPVFETLEEGLGLMEDSVFLYDREGTQAREEAAREVLGDILPVQRKNSINYWEMGITQRVVNFMGMENMFYAMEEEPEQFHQMMELIQKDMVRLLRWEEGQGLLYANSENDYMGSGSYCFNHELPGREAGVRVKSRDTWGHLNSQETIGISPNMFHEFIFPYYAKLAEEYGLVYYGCCEPVSAFWDKGISEIPNLRKVSISPWCDEGFMGERLQGGRIIYSRKPSPNFLGVKAQLDEEAFRKHIRTTAEASRGCRTEFIFRDVYDLHGNVEKLRRAVQITREETQESYCK